MRPRKCTLDTTMGVIGVMMVLKPRDRVEARDSLNLSNNKKGRVQDVMSSGVGGKCKG